MTKYVISFPSSAMVFPEEDFQAVSDESRAVVEEAKAAGVYFFGGGINEDVAPVKVSADGSVVEGTYPETRRIEGGYTILELPTRLAAEQWAARIAAACRCDRELREFMYDPQWCAGDAYSRWPIHVPVAAGASDPRAAGQAE